MGTDFSRVLTSDEPVVVQRTRIDTREKAAALLPTIAYPAW